MMKRRSFLGAMFAACAAPAIVKAGVLMPVKEIALPVADVMVPVADIDPFDPNDPGYVVFVHPDAYAELVRDAVIFGTGAGLYSFENVRVLKSLPPGSPPHESWYSPSVARQLTAQEDRWTTDQTMSLHEYAELQRITMPKPTGDTLRRAMRELMNNRAPMMERIEPFDFYVNPRAKRI